MLLTEQEIREAHEKHSNEFLFEDTINFARAIEAKVIEKIKAQGFVGTYDDTFGFNCPGFYFNAEELIKDGKIDPLYRLPEGD